MDFIKKNYKGIIFCLAIAVPASLLGKKFPVIGGAVIAILSGMLIGAFFKDKGDFAPGIKFTSKKVLQYAVILLGFGMNLNVIMKTGTQSLPIILMTIATSLIVAYFTSKILKIDNNISTLIGVGSSICGGSAIAATAPVIEAKEEEIAQAISVIFFYNVLAALVFPALGSIIGYPTNSGEAFGIFSGSAVNDTSSVTATAATWDSMYNLGSATLDKAVTVKLTRTLAIIPITLALAYKRSRKNNNAGEKISIKKVFPFFILFFILASIITTIAFDLGVPASFFAPFKDLSKFFIVMAMAAIGLNTDIVKLIKTGGKPLTLGFLCWICITMMTVLMQKLIGFI